MSARNDRKAAALLASGFQELQQGRSEQARLLGQQALEAAPGNPDALHLLGVLALQRADHAAAVDLLKRAVAARPDDAALQCNLAYACVGVKRLPEAITAFECAARLDPADPDLKLGHGNCLAMAGRIAEAESVFRRLVEQHPGYPLGWLNLGNVVKDQERHEEARELYLRALALKPDSAEGYFQLGNACGKLEQLDEAARCLERAISLAPDHAGARNNLGMLLWQRGDYESALARLREALSLKPDYPEAHYNIAMVHLQQDRAQEALESLERALHSRPTYAEAKFGRGLLRLMRGDLEGGWEDYEWRFRRELADEPIGIRASSRREWRGEPLAGRKILVWGEQGIGDQLLQAGMIGEVAAASAHCVLECAPKLAPLFTRSFPRAAVVASSNPPHDITRGEFDYQAPAGDLARWLRASPGDFPAHQGYLVPDPARVACWKERLSALGAGPKIGFAWRSSNVKRDRAPADIRLDGWGPVFNVPRAHFVCLQYGDCAAELARAQERLAVPLHAFPEIDLFNDLEEAAALTRAVDLVVSAPTAVSVLSAALGVPTWQLSFGLDWQRLGTGANPWLPAMRVFWRRWDQSWEEVLLGLAGELARHLEPR